MKTLISLAMLLSVSAFAQYNDGYHNEPQYPQCQREACVTNGEAGYGFYETMDREGETFFKLNVESSLLDMDLSQYCYTGDYKEVTEILGALAGNSQRNHIRVGKMDVLLGLDNELIMNITEDSDYAPFEQDYTLTLEECK